MNASLISGCSSLWLSCRLAVNSPGLRIRPTFSMNALKKSKSSPSRSRCRPVVNSLGLRTHHTVSINSRLISGNLLLWSSCRLLLSYSGFSTLSPVSVNFPVISGNSNHAKAIASGDLFQPQNSPITFYEYRKISKNLLKCSGRSPRQYLSFESFRYYEFSEIITATMMNLYEIVICCEFRINPSASVNTLKYQGIYDDQAVDKCWAFQVLDSNFHFLILSASHSCK